MTEHQVAWRPSWASEDEVTWDGRECRNCSQRVPVRGGVLEVHARQRDGGDYDVMETCPGSDREARGDVFSERGGQWVLLAKGTGKVLGTHATREAALAQERAVQANKSDAAQRVTRYDYSSPLKPPVRTPEGFLRVDGRIARVGVQVYRDAGGQEFRELRLPEEVFDVEAVRSFALLPVTNQHPPVLLTPKNARQYTVGALGEPRQAAEWLSASMLIHDAEAIAAAEAGRSQLSNGYSAELDVSPPDPALVEKYGRYDAIQRRIRGNHCALVDSARAGPEARLRLDSGSAVVADFWSAQTAVVASEVSKAPSKETTKMAHELKIDGLKFEVNDPNAQALVDRALSTAADKATAEKQRADAAEKARAESERLKSEVQAKHDALVDQIKADEEKMVKCDECEGSGKCDNCGGKGEYPAKMDTAEHRKASFNRRVRAAVNQRAALVSEARRHLGANEKLDDLTDDGIRRRVVAKLAPQAKLDGANEVYVQARYDACVEQANKVRPIDSARAAAGPPPAMGGPVGAPVTLVEDQDGDARERMIERDRKAFVK